MISSCQLNAAMSSCCEVRYDIVGHDHMICALLWLYVIVYNSHRVFSTESKQYFWLKSLLYFIFVVSLVYKYHTGYRIT